MEVSELARGIERERIPWNKGRTTYDKLQVISLYNSGLSCRSVASQLAIPSAMTVYGILLKTKNKPRSPSEASRLAASRRKYPEVSVSPEQKQIILGTLFGDGTLRLQSGNHKTPYFSTIASESNKSYLIWKYERLRSTGLFRNGLEPAPKGKYLCWRLRSISHPVLLNFYSMFYQNGSKVATDEALSRLDDLGLAVWYCDDGYFNSKYQLFLATECFGKLGNLLIKQWFFEKYGLVFHIYHNIKGQPILGLPRIAQVNKFCGIVAPHICESMMRKIGRQDDVLQKSIDLPKC